MMETGFSPSNAATSSTWWADRGRTISPRKENTRNSSTTCSRLTTTLSLTVSWRSSIKKPGRTSSSPQMRDLTRARYTWKYFPFDILSFDGHDKSHLPFIERDAFLKSIIPGDLNYVQTVETHTDPNTFAEIYDTIMQEHGEGLVLKMPDSPYQFGKRNANWIKGQEMFWRGLFRLRDYQRYRETCEDVWRSGAWAVGMGQESQQYAIKNVGLCSGFTDEEHQELYDSIMQMPESKILMTGRWRQKKGWNGGLNRRWSSKCGIWKNPIMVLCATRCSSGSGTIKRQKSAFSNGVKNGGGGEVVGSYYK